MRGIKNTLIDGIVKGEEILENPSSILLNGSWRVLDKENECEVVIFQRSNTLIYSMNGVVKQCTWEYLPLNKSIVLNLPSISYMLLPVYHWNNIVFFQVYSTRQYVIFMNEQDYLEKYNQKPFIFESFIKSVYDSKQKQLETIRIRKQKERDLERLRWKLEEEVSKEMEKHRFWRWCENYLDIDLKVVFYVGLIFLGVCFVTGLILFGISLLFKLDSLRNNVELIWGYLLSPFLLPIEMNLGDGFWWWLLEVVVRILIIFIYEMVWGLFWSIVPIVLHKIAERKEEIIRKKLRAKDEYRALK